MQSMIAEVLGAVVKRAGPEKNSGRWTFWLVQNRAGDQYVRATILFLTCSELFLERNCPRVRSIKIRQGWETYEMVLFTPETSHETHEG